MRPRRELGYEVTKLPPVPEVLAFLVDHAGMSAAAAYSTFNMGSGYAVYCAPGRGRRRCSRCAPELGLGATSPARSPRGRGASCSSELGVVYESGDLDLTPRA